MKDILDAVVSGTDLTGAVAAFGDLSREDKLALLERMKAFRQESLGTFLNAVYPGEEDKEVRKGIKKLIFRLRSMGIPVEEPAAQGDPVYRRIEEKRDNRGFLSNYDEMGTRVVAAYFQIKTNSFALLNAITHFSRGLLELTIVPVGRRDLEQIIATYQKGTSSAIAFAGISPGYATHLMEEGAKVSGKHIDDLAQLKQFTAHVASEMETPQDLYGLSVPEGTEPAPVEEYVHNPLFERFSLTWDEMEGDRKELETIKNPTISVPQHMIEERKLAFLDRVMKSDRLQTLKHPFKRLMEDYAYLFYTLGDYGSFTGCLKGAKDEKDLNTILSYFILKAVEKTGDEKPPEPGLIVRPYEQVRS